MPGKFRRSGIKFRPAVTLTIRVRIDFRALRYILPRRVYLLTPLYPVHEA